MMYMDINAWIYTRVFLTYVNVQTEICILTFLCLPISDHRGMGLLCLGRVRGASLASSFFQRPPWPHPLWERVPRRLRWGRQRPPCPGVGTLWPSPGECSPPVTGTNVDVGTIGTAWGKHAINPPSLRTNCRCFYTGKIYGGQDHVFLFWGSLANYEGLQSTL
jgi:hypothetical protein